MEHDVTRHMRQYMHGSRYLHALSSRVLPKCHSFVSRKSESRTKTLGEAAEAAGRAGGWGEGENSPKPVGGGESGRGKKSRGLGAIPPGLATDVWRLYM